MKFRLLPLAIAALVSSAVSTAQAAPPTVTPGPSSPVQVMNTPSNPVPVTGSIGLTGNANVTVTNTAANPLPVRDVDNAARQPFQAALCKFVGSSGSYCGTKPSSIAVPTDRRAVIEYASGRCPKSGLSLSTGEDWAASLQTTAGGTEARHLLHPVPGISIGSPQLQSEMGLNGFDVTQMTRIYADPGSLIGLDFEDLGGLGSNVIICEITISGYTVAP